MNTAIMLPPASDGLKIRFRLYDWVHYYEKMLYDNAQLAQVYLHAWQFTGDPFFKRIATETLGFVAHEMTDPQGGFYSSLDADSEGEEGKFHAWTLSEIQDALAEDAKFFIAAYGITAKGNWEGRTVLQRALDDATLAAKIKLPLEQIPVKLAECHSKLYTVRTARIRPGTDDKVLTGWNGLMLAAFAEAGRFLDPKYTLIAQRNADFLLTSLRPNGALKRSWRAGRTTDEVYLEDYAALILGLIALYQTDFDTRWFASACELAEEMIELFADDSGGFFDTLSNLSTPQPSNLIYRPKDLQDNATPSGNALAAEALIKLSAFTENGRWRDIAEKTIGLAATSINRYPSAFARWLSAADFARGPVKQAAVVGDLDRAETQALITGLRSGYRPNLIVAASALPLDSNAPALLADRPLVNGKPAAYICEGFVCKQPVTDVGQLVL
jgi:hypothetical protein